MKQCFLNTYQRLPFFLQKGAAKHQASINGLLVTSIVSQIKDQLIGVL